MSTAETLVPHVPESTEQLPLPVGQGEQNIQVRVQHDVRELHIASFKILGLQYHMIQLR